MKIKDRPVTDTSIQRIHGWRYWLLQPLALFIRLWFSTLRIKISKEDQRLLKELQGPTIMMFWHSQLFVMIEIRRRFLRGRRLFGLVSTSKDGAWLTAFSESLGIEVVRGSSNRRGAAALIELRRALDAGHDIAVTPDGPRGPAGRVKPGVVLLAQHTDAALLIGSCRFEKAWRLKSWDRLRIPKPFSTLSLRIKYHHSFKSLGCDSVQAATDVIESQLRSLGEI